MRTHLLIITLLLSIAVYASNPAKTLVEYDTFSTIFNIGSENFTTNPPVNQITISSLSANDFVIVDLGLASEAKVMLLNLHGSEVFSVVIYEKTSISLTDYAEGIYFIKIITQNEEVVKKLIIKR